MSGTVNISRRLFKSEAFKKEPLTEREAWVWLIMAASWKPRVVRAGDYVVETQRGQLAHSVRYMAGAWIWTPAKVQRYLKRLEKLKMICSETDTGVSVITICNYEEYQGGAQPSDTGPIQDRYRTDTDKKKDERRKEGNKREANASLDARVGEILSEVSSPQVAADFVAHRRELRKPLTERAARAIVNKLRDHRNPDACLTDSIANGWQGVFPEKANPRHKEKPSGNDIANQIAARFGEMDYRESANPVIPLLPARHAR